MSRALPAVWPAGLFSFPCQGLHHVVSCKTVVVLQPVPCGSILWRRWWWFGRHLRLLAPRFSLERTHTVKIEHLAWNVEDPISVARWYVENLGFSIKRKIDAPPWIHFLADDSGKVMLELYGNTSIDVHGFGEIAAMALHLALVSADIEADMARLVAAGGTQDGEISTNDSGDRLGMVRDPWGFCLQLVQRTEPMI